MSLILTPEDSDFYLILHSKLPPGSTAKCYAPDADTGILKPLNDTEEVDYVVGGEMELSEQYLIENECLSLI
ncbi:MAG: hypothetical protein MK111_08705 [Crocosphaera sp.]|uniref:Uncharacterized protein n=3 Tax=Crocosphaera watsonii TaxID=263511 RepID=T2JRJ8_CROWT|nr:MULTISPECIES: hypothetical protein [Crocosphaera]EHJ12870.1 hypothetical protein CWATWH0003_2432 [Crocosphaera watsonii WH 0003]MCH2244706.1 hypothetical protein [Crocosphaera sp.]CCQ58346.1 hypothetical protein CWATWH0005_262 [Crocosphaera watsonii WH 0005]CCQ68478.1 hypothetical protein CWATWH0402_5460 [Crocosphaera watsonii WH 0402]